MNDLSGSFPSESYFKRTAIQNISWKLTSAFFPEAISYQKYLVNRICNILLNILEVKQVDTYKDVEKKVYTFNLT